MLPTELQVSQPPSAYWTSSANRMLANYRFCADFRSYTLCTLGVQLAYTSGSIVSVDIGAMSVEGVQLHFLVSGTNAAFHKTLFDPWYQLRLWQQKC